MTGAPRTWTGYPRREWAKVHPGLRPAVVALLCAGVVLAVLGAAGDAAGFWSRYPFLTNLASSLTAALFGLPVALVVVQRLLQVQTDANERAAAWRLAMRSAHGMRAAAGTLAGPDADDAAAELARLVARCHAAVAGAREWADRALAARSRPRRLRASMYQRAYLRHVLTAHGTAEQALEAYARTGMGAGTSAPAIERIRSEAAFLHDHVRPAVLRLDGRWLPAPQAQVLTNVDEHVPADLPRAAAGHQLAVRRLLDAVPAAQLAALLPEADTARAGLADADRPLPFPAMDRLDELSGELGGLVACLDAVRRIANLVDGVHDAVADRVSGR
jgi:hypothetical protein